MKAETFKEYVIRVYKGADNPKGDFAYDLTRDTDFPEAKTRDELRAYLKDHGADKVVISVFEELYEEYIY